MLRHAFVIFVLVAISNSLARAQDVTSSIAMPPEIRPVQFEEAAPIDAADAGRNAANLSGNSKSGAKQIKLPANLLGTVDQVDLLPADRRSHALSPATDAVFGSEAKGRVSNDVGDLLRKAISSHGVATQDRTPIVTDTRIRGQRTGQVLASGSYWTPVRMDLDTMMNKIDSRLIDNLIVIKGPYSSRYGPGFRFVDFNLIETPRYNSFEAHGSTSFDYDTNGQQAYGRQSAWGGGQDWGVRVSYGHRTGNDYRTGAGTEMPSSYKSRDLFVAFGWDPTPNKHLEFNYLRLDQTDLEFPGLVYDLNFLVTDGYELKYVDTDPVAGDRTDAEVWYNRTRFSGDTLRPSKARQIPNLSTILFSPPPGTSGFAVTDGDGMSLGYRVETTFGRPGQPQLSIGTDVTHLRQNLNDVEPLLPAADNNFPIPSSHATDIGLYVQEVAPVNDWLTITGGARLDYVVADADNIINGVPDTTSQFFDDVPINPDFLLWSAFITADIQLSQDWTASVGGGMGQRPPNLTELYTMASFIGSLQRGLTSLLGDPLLKEERLKQIDLGLRGNFGEYSVGAHGYFSWIDNLITYDLLDPAGAAIGGAGALQQTAAFINTDEAIIAGFEVFGQAQLADNFTSFGTISYIEGRDLTRNTPSRFGLADRSDVAGRDRESLPGITPLETRLGIRFHDAAPQQNWGIELAARIVDNQDRVAASLEEIETPGFTTYDIRGFRRFGAFLITAGCENFTDKFYREHLDYRTGRGVFRPGINFYSGVEVFY